MFSINRRRFTAQALLSSSRSETTNSANQRFVLAVPTADMEDLVRNVGSVSGVYGISKFPDDHNHQVDEGSVSSNKKRKKGRPKFPHGIPGLRAVPVGQQSPDKTKGEDAFAIQGTISHLVCCVDKVMEEDALDDEHYLVIAHVERAFVHSSYFDTNKNLFRPQDDTIAPYLTFFGSQTFGYVVSNKQSTTDIA